MHLPLVVFVICMVLLLVVVVIVTPLHSSKKEKNHYFDFNMEPRRKMYTNSKHCHTYGCHIADTHTSVTYLNSAEGHKTTITRTNIIGGYTRGSFVCLWQIPSSMLSNLSEHKTTDNSKKYFQRISFHSLYFYCCSIITLLASITTLYYYITRIVLHMYILTFVSRTRLISNYWTSTYTSMIYCVSKSGASTKFNQSQSDRQLQKNYFIQAT